MTIDSNARRGSPPRRRLISPPSSDGQAPTLAGRDRDKPEPVSDWLQQSVSALRDRPERARARAPVSGKRRTRTPSSSEGQGKAPRPSNTAESRQPVPRYLVYPASTAFRVPAALSRNTGVAATVRRVRVVADPATAGPTQGHAFDGFAMFGCQSHVLERLFVIDPYTAVLLEWRLDQVEYPAGIPIDDAVSRPLYGETP